MILIFFILRICDNSSNDARFSTKEKTMKKIYGIALAVACGLAATLKAQDIYVANYENGTIGEYGLDGSTINASLISGLDNPNAVAISGNDLFVVNGSGVGEYTTSGATVNASLISVDAPYAIAISGNDLFVTSAGTVGEYTTSGAPVNPDLISGLDGRASIAISGTDLFVVNDYYYGTIGEYTTSGATVNASLISGEDLGITGIAISGNTLFVLNSENNAVNRGIVLEYSTSGGAYTTLIPADSGLWGPTGIAISGNNLFVVNDDYDTVGEYGLDGATVNASLISDPNGPAGIAVNPVPEPSNVMFIVMGAAIFLASWRIKHCIPIL